MCNFASSNFGINSSLRPALIRDASSLRRVTSNRTYHGQKAESGCRPGSTGHNSRNCRDEVRTPAMTGGDVDFFKKDGGHNISLHNVTYLLFDSWQRVLPQSSCTCVVEFQTTLRLIYLGQDTCPLPDADLRR